MAKSKLSSTTTDSNGLVRTQTGATKPLGSKISDPMPNKTGVPLVDGVEDLTIISAEALHGQNHKVSR